MELDNKKLENNEISKEDLGKVSGGHTFNAGKDAAVKSKRFEVIDDKTGKVFGRYSSKREARKVAETFNNSSKTKELHVYWREIEQ